MAASGAASAGARIVPRAALATHQKCETDSKQCEGPDTAQTSFAVVMLRCPLSMATSACQQSGKLLTFECSKRHRKSDNKNTGYIVAEESTCCRRVHCPKICNNWRSLNDCGFDAVAPLHPEQSKGNHIFFNLLPNEVVQYCKKFSKNFINCDRLTTNGAKIDFLHFQGKVPFCLSVNS